MLFLGPLANLKNIKIFFSHFLSEVCRLGFSAFPDSYVHKHCAVPQTHKCKTLIVRQTHATPPAKVFMSPSLLSLWGFHFSPCACSLPALVRIPIAVVFPHHCSSSMEVRVGIQTRQEPWGRCWRRGHGGHGGSVAFSLVPHGPLSLFTYTTQNTHSRGNRAKMTESSPNQSLIKKMLYSPIICGIFLSETPLPS